MRINCCSLCMIVCLFLSCFLSLPLSPSLSLSLSLLLYLITKAQAQGSRLVCVVLLQQHGAPPQLICVLEIFSFFLLSSFAYCRRLLFLWENFGDTRSTVQYYRVNLKIDFWRRQKNTRTHYADHGGIIEKIFFQANQTNDTPKEPHRSANNRTFVPEKWGWFWASVEVHIQNSIDRLIWLLIRRNLRIWIIK